MGHEEMVESGAESWYVRGTPPKCEAGDFQTKRDGDDDGPGEYSVGGAPGAIVRRDAVGIRRESSERAVQEKGRGGGHAESDVGRVAERRQASREPGIEDGDRRRQRTRVSGVNRLRRRTTWRR
jgi:hypothetical protein